MANKGSLFDALNKIRNSGKQFEMRPDIPADSKIPQYKEYLETLDAYRNLIDNNDQEGIDRLVGTGVWDNILYGANNNYADVNRLIDNGAISKYDIPVFSEYFDQRNVSRNRSNELNNSLPYLNAKKGSRK